MIYFLIRLDKDMIYNQFFYYERILKCNKVLGRNMILLKNYRFEFGFFRKRQNEMNFNKYDNYYFIEIFLLIELYLMDKIYL